MGMNGHERALGAYERGICGHERGASMVLNGHEREMGGRGMFHGWTYKGTGGRSEGYDGFEKKTGMQMCRGRRREEDFFFLDRGCTLQR